MYSDFEIHSMLFSMPVAKIMLSKPLTCVSREIQSGSDNRWDFIANYRDGTWSIGSGMYITTDDHVQLYLMFKRHWLMLNKIKFGDKCRFEFSHL